MAGILARLIVLFGLAWAMPGEADDSLRCDGGLIRLGDGTWQVKEACGEPDYRNEQAKVNLGDRGVIGPVQEWYYNQGAHKLIRVLYFRDGDLDRITKAGHGFTRPRQRPCTPYVLEPGLSKFEVRSICGEPAFSDTRYYLRDPGVERVDEWVYKFGSQYFTRELKFIDGKLEEVEKIR